MGAARPVPATDVTVGGGIGVTVRCFGPLRDAVGSGVVTVDAEAASLDAIWNALECGWPAVATLRDRVRPAVNRHYSDWAAPVGDGDEVAFIPPVSGG